MADDSANSPEGKTSNPLVAILLVVNALSLGGVAYLQYKAHLRELSRPSIFDVVKAQVKELDPSSNDKSAAGTDGNQEVTDGLLLPLAPFTANLAQGDGPRRYIRLDAVLKFSKDSKEEEFKTRLPQIRDVVISILNSKKPEDILKIEGKSYLKEEIKTSINSFLIDGEVIDVYYVGLQIN